MRQSAAMWAVAIITVADYFVIIAVRRYGLMLECWRQNPSLRPSFEHVVKVLDSYLASSVPQV